MCIFLSLSDVQLLQALAGDIFAEGVLHILLGEENVYPSEGCIVWSHAVVLEMRDGLHTLLFHVLLREHDGQFSCAVVAEIEKDDNITFLDATIDAAVDERLHELVGVLVLLRVRIVA